MGGCYSGGYEYRNSDRGSRSHGNYSDSHSRSHENYSNSHSNSSCSRPEVPAWAALLKKFAKSHDNAELMQAYKSFFNSKSNGFFAELAKACGIPKVDDIPKEFPEIEYEVKLDISLLPHQSCDYRNEEPSTTNYLDAFDFPIGAGARFLKDPIHTSATGINRFYGNNLDERLVVIEKGGKTFLKEKGKVTPLNIGIPFEQIVIKRTETRVAASLDEILDRTSQVNAEEGVCYRGKIRKEKGDDFILDTNDGRIYSFTITVAYLTKASEKTESGVQRQLELEYAGFIPGFPGFEKDNENQIVQNMIDLAKYTCLLYQNAPIPCKSRQHSHRIALQPTDERKYDFVLGVKKGFFNQKLVPLLGAEELKSGRRKRVAPGEN